MSEVASDIWQIASSDLMGIPNLAGIRIIQEPNLLSVVSHRSVPRSWWERILTFPWDLSTHKSVDVIGPDNKVYVVRRDDGKAIALIMHPATYKAMEEAFKGTK